VERSLWDSRIPVITDVIETLEQLSLGAGVRGPRRSAW
jgi:hypothetical protein